MDFGKISYCVFYKYLSSKYNFVYNMTKRTDILDKNTEVLRYEFPEFFLGWEKFQKKYHGENQNPHSISNTLSETLAVYDVITTNKSERGQINYLTSVIPLCLS